MHADGSDKARMNSWQGTITLTVPFKLSGRIQQNFEVPIDRFALGYSTIHLLDNTANDWCRWNALYDCH